MNKRNILFLSLLFFWDFDAYSRVTSPSAFQSACHAIWSVHSPLPEHFEVGTGFFISPKLLITNLHVIERALLENRFESLYLKQNENIKKIKGILALSISHDLALLEIEGKSDFYLTLKTSLMDKEEKHFIVGYPSAQFRIMETTGPIKEDLDDLSVPINSSDFSGASGSPLLDSKSQISGVLYSSIGSLASLTSKNALKQFIEENKNNICKQSEYKECLTDLTENFLKKIESGSATATDLLQFSGIFLEGKLGIEPNYQKAYEWADKADQQGNLPPAKYTKAVMYLNGHGVKQDLQKAYELFLSAGKQGHFAALFQAGVMLYDGEGVKKDRIQAYEIFKDLASQGHTESLFYIGMMLYKGDGVEQNHEKALPIFLELSRQGHDRAIALMIEMLYKGEGLKQDRIQAFKIPLELAKKGDYGTLYSLYIAITGFYYKQGSVVQNYEQIHEISLKLADSGNPFALLYKGLIFYFGKEVKQDYEQAFVIFSELAKKQIQDLDKSLLELKTEIQQVIQDKKEFDFKGVQ